MTIDVVRKSGPGRREDFVHIAPGELLAIAENATAVLEWLDGLDR